MTCMVESRGYAIERHYATTPDGYILGMFRMPRAKGEQAGSARKKQVVYLNHALLDSSWAFVCNGPSESLGFLLADAGYDVWFGNNRGNQYSTNHSFLALDSKAYWDFSYDQMALLDLPTHIEYVLAATGAKTLSYIGHSQGTIQAFAGFSVNQTVASKVNIFVALAPVAYVHHAQSLLIRLMMELRMDVIFERLGIKEFLPQSTGIQQIGPLICEASPWVCDRILQAVVGPSHHMNGSRLDVYVSETPSGTSTKNLVHWGQGMRSEVFQMFDEGSIAKNVARYGQAAPPAYDLGQVRVPTVLVTGRKDYLANPRDVSRLVASLPPGVLRRHIDLPDYAHLDFTWSVTAKTAFYDQVLSMIREAQPAAEETTVLV